jgi:hypothetical protein
MRLDCVLKRYGRVLQWDLILRHPQRRESIPGPFIAYQAVFAGAERSRVSLRLQALLSERCFLVTWFSKGDHDLFSLNKMWAVRRDSANRQVRHFVNSSKYLMDSELCSCGGATSAYIFQGFRSQLQPYLLILVGLLIWVLCKP